MKRKLILMGAIIALSVSCSKEPTACFDLDKTTAGVNEIISVDASCSQNADSYMWLGGDEPDSVVTITGNASSANEGYSYSQPGTYTIKLLVTNGKKSAETTKSVTIN